MNACGTPERRRRGAAFETACRRQRLKLTHQRLEIFHALAATVRHPDAETLYRCVRRRVAGVSRDTVYRALRLFETLGLARQVATVRDRARYDADPGDHHHFVCTACGQVLDVPRTAGASLRRPAGLAPIGSVASVRVEWRGRCRRCARIRTAARGGA